MFSGVAWVLSEVPATSMEYPLIAGFGVVALIVGFGLAAARYGDKFWYSVLRFY
jgi:Flp pilus assembly pilin Flp